MIEQRHGVADTMPHKPDICGFVAGMSAGGYLTSMLGYDKRWLATHDGEDDGRGFGMRLKPEAIDESKAVTAAIECGGVIFFHDLTLHASHNNSIKDDRWVWIPTYRNARHNDPDYSFAIANEVVRGTGL